MARLPPKIKPGQKITPLTIVASFLGITEIVLGYVAVQVTGRIQIALTVFVMVFTFTVAAAFFAILWNRPWVFYAPSEFGDVDPQDYTKAMRQSPTVSQQVELVKSVENDPSDLEARFSLIDTMADEADCQWAIWMHETGKDAPRATPHVYSYGSGRSGSGYIGFGARNSLEGTGMFRQAGGGHVALTEEGHQFAQWLLSKGRKCDLFWTPLGGWGTVIPGSNEEKWVQNTIARVQQTRAGGVPVVIAVPPTDPTAQS